MVEKLKNKTELSLDEKDSLLIQTLIYLKNLPEGAKSVKNWTPFSIRMQRID